MKKVILLSLMLLALAVTMVKINAATNVPISLTINQGTLSCANSTGAGALGSVSASLSAQSITWVFAANSWTCTDMKWVAWTNTWQKVQSSALTANGGALTIAASNVKMISANPTTSAWNITGTSTLTTLTSIDSPQFVIVKAGASTIGTLQATPTLVVVIPANQTPAAYTGLITVTDPTTA